MNSLKLLLISVLSLYIFPASAQQFYLSLDTSVHVSENGVQLNKAWAGGMDCPMYSAMDINGDGVKDMIVYDHKTGRIITYINNNLPAVSYRYAPEYAKYFPVVRDWIKLYDYDCDGFEDIFTHGNGGIACWKNNGTNPVSFTFITPQINTLYHFGTTYFSSNIFVSSINVPTFVDMDNDGDMDILSFPLGGSYIEYHKNYSMDSTGLCGGFRFYNIRQCWGYFTLQGNTNQAVLPPVTITSGACPAYSASYPRLAEIPRDTLRHAGNILESIDVDGDGDKDLITGDIVGTTLLYIENGGTLDSSYAVSQDTLFPSYNVPAIMENIAAPYIMDVDNDGKKDMMVANFNADFFQGSGENYLTTQYYRNVSSNPAAYQFQFVQNNFMNEEMIDVGSGAHPAFFDADADGLLDLIIGSDFYYYTGGVRKGQLTYYRNTGTASTPQFELVTRDYAGLSAQNFLGIYPTFGDLDGDGDMDMILGNSDATITLYRNTAGAGNPASFVLDSINYQGISVGSNGQQSIPVLYDLNKDFRLDLIIGKRSGVLYYYQNTGSASNPVFTFITDTLGGVDVHDPQILLGYSAPLFFDSAGVTNLLVGNYSGYIYHYNNIDNNLNGNFNLVSNAYYDIYEPLNAVPAMADLNNDGLNDFIIGNLAGGVRYYSERITSLSEFTPDPGFKFYPNPANGYIYIEFNVMSASARTIIISDVLGRTRHISSSSAMKTGIDINTLHAGSYIITVNDKDKILTQKLIIY